MTRFPLIAPLCFILFGACTPACSGPSANPGAGDRERVPVEFHGQGFDVGGVTYSGVCQETAIDRCQSDRSDCFSSCSGLSYEYVTSCTAICADWDCSSYSQDVCFDYEAKFDFGPAD